MATLITPENSTLRVGIEVNAEGNIAQDGETAAGTKNFNIKYFKTLAPSNSLNTFDIANYVALRIVEGILEATFLQSTLQQTIVRKYGDS